jgi:hypothetical protein
MFYRPDGTTTVVQSQAEEDALSGGWFESPADFGLVTAPSVAQMAAGSAAAQDYAPQGVMITPDANTITPPTHGRGHGRGGSHG